MTSPLFRTLSLGSLRYWSVEAQVIDTQVFNSLDLIFDNRETFFTVEFPESEMILQGREFALDFDKEFDLVLESDEIKQGLGCL